MAFCFDSDENIWVIGDNGQRRRAKAEGGRRKSAHGSV